MGTVTPSESANRTRVALWMADVIAGMATPMPGHDLADITAALPDDGWQLVVDAVAAKHPEWTPADGYLPSPATRSAVVTVLRERAAKPNPFAGFPTT